MWVGLVTALLIEFAGFWFAIWLFVESSQLYGIIILFIWTFLAFAFNQFLAGSIKPRLDQDEESKPWTYVP